jgi:hypothetical protein
MDKITDSVRSVQHESSGFFNYVFKFDNENKHRIMNMLQYTLLSIIPVLLILRAIKHIIPEDDESKGSIEILAESVGQVILIMLAIWITNKIINFIPTYSGEDYPKFNEISFVIPFIIILATMQTKLGAKFNILIDRFLRLINFKEGMEDDDKKKGKDGQNVVRVTQPLGGGGGGMGGGPYQPSQADYLDRNQLLPSNPMLSAMPTKFPPQQLQQQQPAQGQGQDYFPMSNEPMAANDGASGWSSW